MKEKYINFRAGSTRQLIERALQEPEPEPEPLWKLVVQVIRRIFL